MNSQVISWQVCTLNANCAVYKYNFISDECHLYERDACQELQRTNCGDCILSSPGCGLCLEARGCKGETIRSIGFSGPTGCEEVSCKRGESDADKELF